MKSSRHRRLPLLLGSLLLAGVPALAQTVYIPSGTSGIGSSSNGNVGVGTATPAYKLTVVGGYLAVADSSTGPLAFVQGWTNASLFGSVDGRRASLGNSENWETLTVDNGSVAIGTTDPGSFRLKVQGGYSGFLESAGVHGISLYPNHAGFNQIYSDYLSGATALPLSLGAYPRLDAMNVLSNGNVGINTTVPLYKLVVSDNGAAALEFDPAGTQLPGGVGIQAYNRATSAYVPILIYGSKVLLDGGNIGIGTANPTHKLSVNGTIRAKEVIVDNTGWSDYVFAENYRLAPLAEVEAHIKAEKHLPGIPSAAEVAEHGVSMGEMQSKLLAKIEELTLHVIRIEKENAALRHDVESLKATR